MIDRHVCPRCGSILRETPSLAGGPCAFWRECSSSFCGALVDTWMPLPMQHRFLSDIHRYKGLFGGFGSGKSLTVIRNVQKHCLITPGGYAGVIGNTFRLIRRNFKKDFDEDTPVALLKVEPNQKTPGFNTSEMLYTFKNGAKIELITSDDPSKILGLNATLVVMLEAKNSPYEHFKTSKSRIRNKAASVPEKDADGKIIMEWDEDAGAVVEKMGPAWHHILLESNPDNNWINTRFLLVADEVFFYGDSYEKYEYRIEEIDQEVSVHVSATTVNPHLPKTYIQDNSRGMPDWEIRRFFHGSFMFAENMVYPGINSCVVDRYPIDFGNPRIFALVSYDYGLSNISAFLFGAINFDRHLLTIYDSLGVNEMSVKQIATEYRKKLYAIPDGKLLFLPRMDAKSYAKRGPDKISIGQMFEDVGLFFEPVQADVETRTLKLNTLIENVQLHIFRDQHEPIRQFRAYKWKLNSKGEKTGKRVDKDNDFIDAAEFMTIPLPINLEKMKFEEWVAPGMRVMADSMRRPPQIILDPEQRFMASMNPLNQKFEKQAPAEEKISDDELEKIIAKLSGI